MLSRKWILLLLVLASPYYAVNQSKFCPRTKIVYSHIDTFFAVPIFASNDLLGKSEATSLYEIYVYYGYNDTINVSIRRYFEYQLKNCMLYNTKQFDMDEKEGNSFWSGFNNTNCHINTGDISLIPLTGLFMAEDHSFTLLFTCNEMQTNVTVLGGCLLIAKKGIHFTKELEVFLSVNEITPFPLFKIDYENRFNFFVKNPPISKVHPLSNYFEICPESAGTGTFSLYLVGYVSLIFVVITLVLYLNWERIKFRNHNSVNPLNAT